jgi:pimeloyl-ACP methyl ester carboxylesterase
VSIGSGPPLVVVPGLDGHWQWIAPALVALARDWRVHSFSLPGERHAVPFEPAKGFDGLVAQLELVLDQAGTNEAVVCGVSYGAWVALACAALKPDRVRALVLVSAPAPDFEPSPTQARYLASPRRMVVPFVANAPRRHMDEIRRALPGWRTRLGFVLPHVCRVIATGMSPTRMSARMLCARKVNLPELASRVQVPTLVVTGEPELDHVVPVADSLKYLACIPRARHAVLADTGHWGLITRAEAFARLVTSFAREGGAQERVPR